MHPGAAAATTRSRSASRRRRSGRSASRASRHRRGGDDGAGQSAPRAGSGRPVGGVAATRLRGIATSRRRRDPSPRHIHVAASPRRVYEEISTSPPRRRRDASPRHVTAAASSVSAKSSTSPSPCHQSPRNHPSPPPRHQSPRNHPRPPRLPSRGRPRAAAIPTAAPRTCPHGGGGLQKRPRAAALPSRQNLRAVPKRSSVRTRNFARIPLRCSGARPLHAAHK